MDNSTATLSRGTVFFDYDGTIHDSNRLYAPAFRKAYQWLVDNGYAEPKEITDEWCAQWLGWTVPDMWHAYMPDLPEEVWWQTAKMVGDDMGELARTGHAALYPQVPETLQKLKDEGFKIVFLSNCGPDYRDSGRALFGLDRWFDGYHIATDFPDLAKWEIYREVKDQYPEPHVMVGDRLHDMDVATQNGIASIGCSFGYGKPGELDCADAVVDSFEEIPEALDKILA